MLRYAFGELGLNRVELETYSFNPRAQRCYEKVGFVREGVRRGPGTGTAASTTASPWASYGRSSVRERPRPPHDPGPRGQARHAHQTGKGLAHEG